MDDKEVLEKLVPPSSIQILHITGYIGASIPNWLMGIGQYVPYLSRIDLCDFPNCNNLPPLGQLPNLQSLSLCRMMGLEEWNTTYTSGENELLFPNLKNFTIKHCAKLRISPCLPRSMSLRIVECDNILSSWGESSSHSGVFSSSPVTDLYVGDSNVPMHHWRLLHQLPTLRSLIITCCSDLTTSPKIIQQLSSLQLLSLRLGCNDKAELPIWLYELASLRELYICHPKLDKLNENTRQLTRLQVLSLSECRSMTSLPQWLGELTSLKNLEIGHCEGIRSLPESIRQLSKLEYLNIHSCPMLMKWCESKENKMKLAHIREKFFSRPANLFEEDIESAFPEKTNSLVTATGSKETTHLTNIKDVGDSSAASIYGTVIDDEVHLDLMYSAVMNTPGFTEEALYVALSHLMDNKAQGYAYMGMHEEDRVSWLMNFLKKHY